MTLRASDASAGDAFSPPVSLWCPYCHHPFVGSVERRSGRFVHGDCPVGALDLARIRKLARREWFWARFLSQLENSATGEGTTPEDGPKAA